MNYSEFVLAKTIGNKPIGSFQSVAIELIFWVIVGSNATISQAIPPPTEPPIMA
jgi:hypothetical protein